MKPKYNFPDGFTPLQSIARSYKTIRDPLAAVNANMERFAGTYTGFLFVKGKVIVTSDSDFVNYVFARKPNKLRKEPIGRAFSC